VSARLVVGILPISDPSARLDAPGLALVFLTATGSHLAFTTPEAARQVAAACEQAAALLSGPQVTLA